MNRVIACATAAALALVMTACPRDAADDTAPPAEPGTDAPMAQTAQCTNPVAGYTISYPAGWQVNTGDVMDPCSLFDPEPITVPPASELPIDIAIILDVEPIPIARLTGDVLGRRDVSRDTTTVDGRRAIRIEGETTGEGLHDRGIRSYQYFVELGDSTLIAATYGVGALPLDRKRRVLDEMMATLEFGGTP